MPQPVGPPVLPRPKPRVWFRPRWRAVMVGLCLSAAAGCSSSGQEGTSELEPATDNSAIQESGSLAVTRADGTDVPMPALAPYIWCGPFSEGTIDIPGESVHIYLWPSLDPEFVGEPTGWIIRGLLDEIKPGEPLGLPTAAVDLGKTPPTPNGVDMFAVADLNDFASSAASSSGSIVFESIPCVDGEQTVSATVDVVLGSEDTGAETIRIEGTLSGELNEPPQRDIYRS